MIEKRKEAWNRKSFEEREIINEKRRQNAHCGIYVPSKIYTVQTLYFYAFKFQNGIKFGLTKQSNIYKRWKKKVVEKVLVFEKIPTSEGIMLESKFKKLPQCCRNITLKTTEYLEMPIENFIKLYEEFKCTN
jgi:hypothetical protein